MMFPKSLNWMIYKVSGKWVSGGPKGYDMDTIESLVYVASLAMLADRKIRRVEEKTLGSSGPGSLLSAFSDSINSGLEGDIENIMDTDASGLNTSIFSLTWIEDINQTASNNLSKFPVALVVESAAKNVTKDKYRRLALLGAVRMVACDLQIKSSENEFLRKLATHWNLETLLDDVLTALPNWEEKRTKRLIDKIKTIQGEIDKMLDQGSISMEAYNRLEDRIAKNSPTLGIENEWEKFSENLLSENDELKEHEHQLSIDLAKTKKELERQTAYGHDKESISVVMGMLSSLKFHPSAHKILLEEFPEKYDIYDCLLKINSTQPPQNKPVRGLKGWKEIAKIKTGNPSMFRMGRLYFREYEETDLAFKVYISVKKNEAHQNQTLDLLRHWN